MPGKYAHYRFGKDLLTTMPPLVRRTVDRFRQLYDVGLHGPDLMCYHSLGLGGSVEKLADKYHQQTGQEFFERVCRAVRLNNSEGARAYLYGVLAHYTLDSLCHPYVHRVEEAGWGGHNRIETEFDRFLLELDGLDPTGYDLTPHMHLTPGEQRTVAMFYPNVSPAAIGRCLKFMRSVTRLTTMPPGSRRTVVEGTMKRVMPSSAQLIMPLGPERKLRAADRDLLQLYQIAKERYPGLLEQVQTHLRRKTPLGPDFSLVFD